ncbi:hypothetical protein LTS18_007710, partial [Coniosporium uncinatum]
MLIPSPDMPRVSTSEPFEPSETLHALAATFQARLRSCPDDSQRFQLCEAERDELLKKSERLDFAILAADIAMKHECRQYASLKPQRGRWQEFAQRLEHAHHAAAEKYHLKPMAFWGPELVRYYGWRDKNLTFRKALSQVAEHNRVWDDFVVKANQIMLRRSCRAHKPRPISSATSPIVTNDLDHVKRWTGKDAYQPDSSGLPLHFERVQLARASGHTFDRYGLLVKSDAASPHAEPQSSSRCSPTINGSHYPERAYPERANQESHFVSQTQPVACTETALPSVEVEGPLPRRSLRIVAPISPSLSEDSESSHERPLPVKRADKNED